MLDELRALGKALLPEDPDLSGRNRILTYLQRYPLMVIEGDALRLILGIGDWARRVRELRVQLGCPVINGVTFKEMAADAPETAEQLASELRIHSADLPPNLMALGAPRNTRQLFHRAFRKYQFPDDV